MSITLQLPKLTELRPRITVIGVGGAGCNAVNNMIAAGLTGVEFVVANTDAQALVASSAEHRLQLGINLTEGLGAGSKPEIGEAAAEEAVDEIRAQVSGSHMLFIAAGMGGGTGTGACAVIARVARELGILTVGVVTKPFMFEGTRRQRTAEAGVAELKKHVDTLIVIPNQNLFRVANEKTTFAEAFVLADQVLYSGVACIVDLILKDGLINLDFADVRTVMKGMGAAMMGTGEAVGERRATLAAEEAIANPLLDDVTLKGAKGLLLSITGSHDMTLYEVDEAASRVRQEVDPEANIIVGATFDDSLGDAIRVSIVASGMARAEAAEKQPAVAPDAWPNKKLVPEPVAAPAVASTASLEQRLSEAMSKDAAMPGMADRAGVPRQQATVPPIPPAPVHPRETWQAPGNVTIERGFQPPASGPMPPPPPSQQRPSGVAPAAGGFRPQPPADVRRPARRIPEVDEFPAVGQREYYAKTGHGDGPGGAATSGGDYGQHHQAPEQPRRSLFERITGRARRGADSGQELRQDGSSGTPHAGHRHADGENRHAHNGNHQHSAETAQPDDAVELPMFFSKGKR
ncbi:MAG: cell division protein FtsZ [Hyphomicrobiaceae bacterium]|nr:cell division protein FtsZ [Hyphomicrobiaceae bacterium]